MPEWFHKKSVQTTEAGLLVLSDFDDTVAETKLEDRHVDMALARGRVRPDGLDAYREEVRAAMGGPGVRVIAELYPNASPVERREILADFRHRVKADPEPTRPIVGAPEMLATFHQRGVPVGLLTNRSQGLDRAIKYAGLKPWYFTHVYDDVGERFGSKLPPALLLMAHYALSGPNVLMLGDSTRDDMEPFLALPSEERPVLAFVPKIVLQEKDARNQMAKADDLGALAFRRMEDCKEWAINYTVPTPR